MWTTLLKQPSPSLQWGVVIGASVAAAAFDLRSRRIPNWLTGLTFLLGVASAVWVGRLAGLADGSVACVMMAIPYVLLFLLAGGGAADAKLMGAIGMWLGVRNGLLTLLLVLACGAVFGIAYSIAKRKVASVTGNLLVITVGVAALLTGRGRWSQATKLFPDQEAMLSVPYGVSIFAGVCIAAALALSHPGRALL